MDSSEKNRLRDISDNYHEKIGAAAGRSIKFSIFSASLLGLLTLLFMLSSVDSFLGFIWVLVTTVVAAGIGFIASSLIASKIDLFGVRALSKEIEAIDRQIP